MAANSEARSQGVAHTLLRCSQVDNGSLDRTVRFAEHEATFDHVNTRAFF